MKRTIIDQLKAWKEAPSWVRIPNCEPSATPCPPYKEQDWMRNIPLNGVGVSFEGRPFEG